MTFGANSAIFNCWQRDLASRTASFIGDIDVATFKAALFNDTTTPDNTVASASAAYNAGVWVTANERTDTNWPAGGRGLGTITLSGASGGNFTSMTAANTAGAGNVTLSLVFGDLVYDDALTTPVADQALAYHSYGGTAQGVTAGTFTIVWHANGVVRWTHTPA